MGSILIAVDKIKERNSVKSSPWNKSTPVIRTMKWFNNNSRGCNPRKKEDNLNQNHEMVQQKYPWVQLMKKHTTQSEPRIGLTIIAMGATHGKKNTT
ncbi:hypothetical protein [Chryseobacterium sp. Leaf394]|uniref:hypothetical protein n=1 Tax=Chryseobacterium sp. Leaf394 TaxID=1736361 RepID=UPI0006F777AB|nr:hypothetical protein [Chryseobacterium sp. Leaf394]KQS93060.1 hypothetical protein ASG21_11705 [Chryseobacterium sp. Leaf394]